MSTVAGHLWSDDRLDTPCERMMYDGGMCGMARATLFMVQANDVGKPGYAHYGTLSPGEYQEIVAERTVHEERCARMMSVLRGMCSA